MMIGTAELYILNLVNGILTLIQDQEKLLNQLSLKVFNGHEWK